MRRHAHTLLEGASKVVRGQSRMSGESLQREIFAQMGVDILPDTSKGPRSQTAARRLDRKAPAQVLEQIDSGLHEKCRIQFANTKSGCCHRTGDQSKEGVPSARCRQTHRIVGGNAFL